MLILLLGYGTLAIYQVMAMEDQLDEVTRAIDQMDGKVKRAQYEKGKFYAMARDVLRLAAKDPNADQVAVHFKLRQLQAVQPALMSLSAEPAPGTDTAAPPTAVTNAAPVAPSGATNAAPAEAPVPAAK